MHLEWSRDGDVGVGKEAENSWTERHIGWHDNILSCPIFCSRVCISANKINFKFSVPSPTCKEVKKRSLCPEKGYAGKVTHGCAHGYP